MTINPIPNSHVPNMSTPPSFFLFSRQNGPRLTFQNSKSKHWTMATGKWQASHPSTFHPSSCQFGTVSAYFFCCTHSSPFTPLLTNSHISLKSQFLRNHYFQYLINKSTFQYSIFYFEFWILNFEFSHLNHELKWFWYLFSIAILISGFFF